MTSEHPADEVEFGAALSEAELLAWAQRRYGESAVARLPHEDRVAIIRRLHDDAVSFDSEGRLPMEDAGPYGEFMDDLNDRLRAAGRAPLPVMEG